MALQHKKQGPEEKNKLASSGEKQDKASKVKQFTVMDTGAEKMEHL
jgi:hypothetical protein